MAQNIHSDPHALTCGVDPTEFAERVRAAVRNAAPADYAIPTMMNCLRLPLSGWRARLAKGAARAVVDGFFNSR